MVNFVEFAFFFYIFVGLYLTSLLFFIYISNRKKLFYYPIGKPEPVSIVIPCYNAEKTIGQAIESLLRLNYPREMIEIIVVDDKSTDDSVRIVEEYTGKHSNIKLIKMDKNSGGAAEPTNLGVLNAKYNYVSVTDDDSSPEPDALIKMIGFLQDDEKVAAVTCAVMARNSRTFMQKLQNVEYTIISWSRKLLDCVDSVYVTPGPFALYRKKNLIEVGLFDSKNMTQDIEIVWRLLFHGYKARMCLAARVYSETPTKIKAWWRQRVRWNIGGTQSILKYKKFMFRKGMLGAFIIPFFSFSLFLGLFGLGIFIYLLTTRLWVKYLSTKYSIYAGSTILRFQDLTFNPSVLNFFGIALFLSGLFFTLIGLSVMNEPRFKNKNILNILFYMLVYLALYPFVMVNGLYKLLRGKYSW
ncbi:MAG: glycosyltransferase family 2 protein [Candidatus Pacearchaeota archaeon]|nr:glycosyltransferase family 2 protein [Candidatus Pacearchaeota archaeon]